MRAPERAIARKSLDKRLSSLTNTDAFARPTRGWIKAIREALIASGAAKDGIRIGAEGEKHRNCGEETEGCFQKNRRVEVFVRPDARAAAR